jgi:type IV pilus assembly protein PilY1
VGGCLGIDPKNAFTPTNTIVDFYVESITPTSGQFRINYEDVEQAADHDMDAIARYSYIVLKADGITPAATPEEGAMVRIIVDGGVYASGCIIQHLGYIISGTTKDGTYLEVRDADTTVGNDVDYFLDTPPGEDPGGTWDDSADLPFAASRVFTPGATAGAELLKNPLWYAAKWGSFLDHNFNGKPDLTAEWDEDEDGSPDNYFYVQNPFSRPRARVKAPPISPSSTPSTRTYPGWVTCTHSWWMPTGRYERIPTPTWHWIMPLTRLSNSTPSAPGW